MVSATATSTCATPVSYTHLPDYEIALHELEDDSNRIIAIANGELTGRHIGSPLSNKMLEFVAGNLYETQNYVDVYKRQV